MASSIGRSGVTVVNAVEVNTAIKRVMLEHRIGIQKSLASALTMTRIRAAEHLIPNTSGTHNPYRARKRQPSVPGRLTSRTNKLHFMLDHLASKSNLLKEWQRGTSWGGRLVKERTAALMGQIRSVPLTARSEAYIATYRVNIQGHYSLFKSGHGYPQETLRTLAVRFQWEYGIRGQARPIFKPVVNLTEFDMRRFIEARANAVWKLH